MNMKKRIVGFCLLLLAVTILLGACASYRPQPASEGEYVCVVERGSDLFHRGDCVYARKIEDADKIFFRSYEDAIAAGNKPCKSCIPGDKDGSGEAAMPDSSEK
jgi:methylphosphotriester-DNA--protein-cysteine methyltransferase